MGGGFFLSWFNAQWPRGSRRLTADDGFNDRKVCVCRVIEVLSMIRVRNEGSQTAAAILLF